MQNTTALVKGWSTVLIKKKSCFDIGLQLWCNSGNATKVLYNFKAGPGALCNHPENLLRVRVGRSERSNL